MAAQHPERVSTLVVLSTPHPAALRWALRHGDQARRSWYILAYQLPWLPEWAMARLMRREWLVRTGLPADRARAYAARLGTRGAMRGPVNWYRAALRPSGGTRAPSAQKDRVDVPTTYVWGSRDPFLGRDAAERSARHVSGNYRFVEVAAGHWLPERQPELVAQQVVRRATDG
jgi:pimeloyl-ACP methyl ester carboxylesterase